MAMIVKNDKLNNYTSNENLTGAQINKNDSKTQNIMIGNDIIILFDDDRNTTYRPADVKWESWSTTTFPYSSDSSRQFMEGMPTSFVVRVYFITDEARAKVSAAEFQSFRQGLVSKGTELLYLTVYEHNNDIPVGNLYPDDFNVYSTYVDYHFSFSPIDQPYAFTIESGVPSFTTVSNVTNQILNSTTNAMLANANKTAQVTLNLLD